MTLPAARMTDFVTCPMANGPVPHVGGPIVQGEATILAGNMPLATMGASCTCVGPPATVIGGAAVVLASNKPVARMSDQTNHGGIITMGCPTVLVGTSAGAQAMVDASSTGSTHVATGG